MGERQPPQPGKPTSRQQREARQAAALRANLKRRKAAAKAEPQPAGSSKAAPPGSAAGRS